LTLLHFCVLTVAILHFCVLISKYYINVINGDYLFDGISNDITYMVNNLKSLVGANGAVGVDVDGAPVEVDDILTAILHKATGGDDSITALRDACWKSYEASPFVQTAVGDFVDAIIGDGFKVSSNRPMLRNLVDTHTTDFRNKLYLRYKQFLTHYRIGGQGYFSMTIHPPTGERLVEVDHLAPDSIEEIFFHPAKTHMPLWYKVKTESGETIYILSINVAYSAKILDHPSIQIPKDTSGDEIVFDGYSGDPVFASVRNCTRFIVDWEGETIEKWPKSRLRSIIVWNNLYTMMKLIEIDHKRALASFAWIIQPEDEEALTRLASLTDEQKKATGLWGAKSPGSTLVGIPGCTIKAESPKLPPISGADSDILEMVVAGLNQPSDIVTGTANGTFASVNSTRAPMVERIRHSQSWFEGLLRYEFWKPIIFLHNVVFRFPLTFSERRVIDFEDKKPKWGRVSSPAWEHLNFSFPINENANFSEAVRDAAGSKHVGMTESLGLSRKFAVRRLGCGNYHGERLEAETERELYPDLAIPTDQEALIENRLVGNALQKPEEVTDDENN
jgi:hypothetical protein